MALIKCPECGREKVSDTAEACPECGFGIRAYFEQLRLEEEKQEIPKLYDEDDTYSYKIIVNGFYGTDTAACAGLEEFLEISFEYDEAMKLFEVGEFAIAMYDSEEEAIEELELLTKWGIKANIIDPNGYEKYSNVESYDNRTIMNSFSSKKDSYTPESLNVDGLMKVLCFLIPIVGIIIYCINVSTSPMQSKRCLKISVAGIIIGIILAASFL